MARLGRPAIYYFLPDMHVPFHRKPLWRRILQAVRDMRPEGVILGGDFLDMYSLGKYHADSVYYLRDITLEDEYRAGRLVLHELESVLPRGCRRVYLYGNHEDRYYREIARGDRAKYGGALRSPDEALGLRERGWEVYHRWKDDSYVIIEGVECMHGAYATVHAAKKHLEECHCTVLFGHTHRWQVYSNGVHTAYNVGWLGDRENRAFEYAPRSRRRQWVNGFAIVRVYSTGAVFVEAVQCQGDRFIAGGVAY